MKNRKNNLDEYQEQKLLKIEAGGFWLMYWGLLAVMGVKLALGGYQDGKTMLLEWILFMVVSVYMVFRCLRSGIWDRRLKANLKTNLIVSGIAGAAVWIFNTFVLWRNFGNHFGMSLLWGLIAGVATFLLCLALLSVCVSLMKKRQRQLEAEPEEEAGEE